MAKLKTKQKHNLNSNSLFDMDVVYAMCYALVLDMVFTAATSGSIVDGGEDDDEVEPLPKKQKLELKKEDDPMFSLVGAYNLCEFAWTSSNVIFAGVMPASNCSPGSPGLDATTKQVKHAIGEVPTWIDIIIVSPLKRFKLIGWNRIKAFIEKNHGEVEKLEYLKRIEKAVDSGKHVVFACGEVVEDYLGTSRKNGEVEILFTSSGTPYFLVHGTHPSWHLTPGGRDAAKQNLARHGTCQSGQQDECHRGGLAQQECTQCNDK